MQFMLIQVCCVALSGCANGRTVMDTMNSAVSAVNPANWVTDGNGNGNENGNSNSNSNRTANDTVSVASAKTTASASLSIAGSGGEPDYPSLASVPARPPEPEIKRDYESLRAGLIADQQNAAYRDSALRRDVPAGGGGGGSGASPASGAIEVGNPPGGVQVAQAMPTLTTKGLQSNEQPAPAQQPSGQNVLTTRGLATASPAEPPAGGAVLTTTGIRSTQAGAEPTPTVQPAPAPAPAPAQEPAAAPEPAAETAGTSPSPAAPAPTGATDEPQTGVSAEAPPPSAAAMAESASAAQEVEAEEMPPPDDAAKGQRIATIYFPKGGATLGSHDQDILSQVVDIFRDNDRTITIVGHSSGEILPLPGTEIIPKPDDIAIWRARAVAEALVAGGLDAGRIAAEAMGDRQLRFDEGKPTGVAGNRRAEIFALP